MLILIKKEKKSWNYLKLNTHLYCCYCNQLFYKNCIWKQSEKINICTLVFVISRYTVNELVCLQSGSENSCFCVVWCKDHCSIVYITTNTDTGLFQCTIKKNHEVDAIVVIFSQLYLYIGFGDPKTISGKEFDSRAQYLKNF